MPSSPPAPAPTDPPQAETAWSRALRKLLPAGAPVPDEDHLDYTFSVALPADAPSWGPRTPTSRSSAAVPPLTPFARHRRCISRILRPDPPLRAPSPPSSPDTTSSAPLTPRNPPSPPAQTQPLSPQPLASDMQVASEPGGKRRACARCSEGGIWIGTIEVREECLPCGSRYCAGCVLRDTGSMPEGRKCVDQPVTVARRRARLGNGSRLLARLLAPAEVRQVMRAERGCASNHVRPDEVVVNGRGLSQGDLDLLLGCAVPPERLTPGKYWYDKDSGLWGKLASVQCTRNTHFWLYDDGSYEEEGQNIIKGNIWRKASTRLMASFFSLPIPPGYSRGMTEDASVFE
ncbi:unnamed protein product [Alopecurus aequalis]